MFHWHHILNVSKTTFWLLTDWPCGYVARNCDSSVDPHFKPASHDQSPEPELSRTKQSPELSQNELIRARIMDKSRSELNRSELTDLQANLSRAELRAKPS